MRNVLNSASEKNAKVIFITHHEDGQFLAAMVTIDTNTGAGSEGAEIDTAMKTPL